MNFVKTTALDRVIVKRVSGNYAVHFGHEVIEGGYSCVECVLRYHPTYENVCHIVDTYNSQYGTQYHVTREEYDANAAAV